MTTRLGRRKSAERGALAEELGDREEPGRVEDPALAQEPLAGPDRQRAADHDGRRGRPAGELPQDELDRAVSAWPAFVDGGPDADEDDRGTGRGRAVEDGQRAGGERRGEGVLDAGLA